jgi:hypothetical protein
MLAYLIDQTARDLLGSRRCPRVSLPDPRPALALLRAATSPGPLANAAVRRMAAALRAAAGAAGACVALAVLAAPLAWECIR